MTSASPFLPDSDSESDAGTLEDEPWQATTMTASDIISICDESSTSNDGENNANCHEQLEQFLEDPGSFMDDKVQVVCFPGLSQYSAEGPSACGLIAMNCVRNVLSVESEGKMGMNLLKELLRRETVSNILSICEFWKSPDHLATEEIHRTPLFDASLHLLCSAYGRSTYKKFERMIRQLDQFVKSSKSGRSCAVVITRPPEIVVCFKLFPEKGDELQDIYVVFDSHPRKLHQEGAAFVISTSPTQTAKYLAEIFPLEQNLTNTASSPTALRWQAQLLEHVSGDFFEHSGRDLHMSVDAERAMMDASCKILKLKIEHAVLNSECDSLKRENKRLNDEAEFSEIQRRELSNEESQFYPISPQTIVRDKGNKKVNNSSFLESSPGASGSGSRDAGRHSPQCPNDPRIAVIPMRSQSFDIPPVGKGLLRSERIHRGVGVLRSVNDDHDQALRLQRELIEEEELLSTQFEALKTTYATYECGVCFDEFSRDSIILMDGCSHPFCHTCARSHVKTKIGEHRYPILCPSCTSDGDGRGSASAISEALVIQLGISEEDYAIYMEMQLADFSILIHCRRCRRGAFVDREEYNETNALECPLPNCSFTWCKNCQQEVQPESDPPHSCDGTNELQHLIQRRGWRLCPGCQTPTEKNGGCNHMTCISPGCNTHFCYKCGQLVIRSAIRSEVQRALERHYGRCELFNPGEAQ